MGKNDRRRAGGGRLRMKAQKVIVTRPPVAGGLRTKGGIYAKKVTVTFFRVCQKDSLCQNDTVRKMALTDVRS